MAVNVNTVYQRVLTIANKEQRGYITPQEFNILANQAQMDLFEQYFYDINQFNRLPGNSTEHSDMLYILEEKIAPFRANNSSLTVTQTVFEDTFEADITGWTEAVPTNGVISHEIPAASNSYNGGLKINPTQNTGHTAISPTFSLEEGVKYTVSWEVIAEDLPEDVGYVVTIRRTAGSNLEVQYENYMAQVGSFSFDFTAEENASDAMIRLANLADTDQYITFGSISVKKTSDNTTLPADLYRLGEVYYKASSNAYPKPVAHVNANEATLFNLSPLARPTTSNPAYVRDSATTIKVYPETLDAGSTVTCNYIKTPTDVVWGYTTVNGNALYNANTSTNFEMHESEEVNLVNRILVLAGITIKDNALIGVAEKEEVKDMQQEKS